jgi:hypothetical protein
MFFVPSVTFILQSKYPASTISPAASLTPEEGFNSNTPDLFSSVFSLDPKRFRKSKIKKESSFDEWKEYTSETCSNPLVNGLEWWKVNSNRFPRLSQMAKEYLAIPATSAPCHRLFNAGGNVIPETMTGSQGQRIREAMCLQSWQVGPWVTE